MLKVMALTVLREIAANIRSTDFYTITVDECTDISNQEQVRNLQMYMCRYKD